MKFCLPKKCAFFLPVGPPVVIFLFPFHILFAECNNSYAQYLCPQQKLHISCIKSNSKQGTNPTRIALRRISTPHTDALDIKRILGFLCNPPRNIYFGVVLVYPREATPKYLFWGWSLIWSKDCLTTRPQRSKEKLWPNSPKQNSDFDSQRFHHNPIYDRM